LKVITNGLRIIYGTNVKIKNFKSKKVKSISIFI